MTILEAIQKVDALKPNTYTQPEKVNWLSMLDGIIKSEIIDTHEGWKDVEFNGYNDDTNLNTKLLCPEPWSEIYISWLESKIDYYNGEYVKFNNSITKYNENFSAYSNHYNKWHKPLGTRLRYY